MGSSLQHLILQKCGAGRNRCSRIRSVRPWERKFLSKHVKYCSFVDRVFISGLGLMSCSRKHLAERWLIECNCYDIYKWLMMSSLLLLREDILHILVIMSETYFCFHLVRFRYCQALLVMPQGDDHDYSPLFVGGRQISMCLNLLCYSKIWSTDNRAGEPKDV